LLCLPCILQLDKAAADAAEFKAGFDKLAIDNLEQQAQLDKAAADAVENKAVYDKLVVDSTEQKAQYDLSSAAQQAQVGGTAS
jgi:ribosomal protein S26